MPYFEIKAGSLHMNINKAASYSPALTSLRLVIKEVLNEISLRKGIYLGKLHDVTDTLTWHSHRVTMIDLAARDKRTDNEILLQMHSHDPRMVEKYTRTRGEIPASMVFDLCKSFGAKHVIQAAPSPAESSSPSPAAPDEIEIMFDEDDVCIPHFYHFTPATITPAAIDKLKYHIQSFSEPDRIECTLTYELGNMIAAGTDIPPPESICKRCLARRPDVAAQIGLALEA